MSTIVTILIAPDVLVDLTTATGIIEGAAEARGITARVLVAGTAGEADSVLAELRPTDELIFLPGTAGDLADTRAAMPNGSLIRVDFDERASDRTPGIRAHIRGRGIDGLRFAVDSWFFHHSHPGQIVRYGDEADQKAELRLPANRQGPFPVAVLIHGGYWHSRWEFDLMDAMAVDLTERGYATWNIEYRRPDDSSWLEMTTDVHRAVTLLAELAPQHNLDLARIVALGHSAGGQIVLRLAADLRSDAASPVQLALAVSLAGVLDLETADRRWLGEGAVSLALGARYSELTDVYDASSPLRRLPIGVPHAVVYGTGDNLDLQDSSRSYLIAANAGTDEVLALEGPGNHFAVIDPDSAIWPDIVKLMQPYSA